MRTDGIGYMRALRGAAFGALLAMLGACGGGPGGGSGGGPDTGDLRKKVLDHVNMVAEGHAHITTWKETGRKMEGEGDFQGCTVKFEGELEFDGECEYDMKQRKRGDRVGFEAEVEFLKDQGGWKQASMGIYPR